MNIRVAIVGPTSYTGLYLIEQLLRHPTAGLTYMAARREGETDMTREFPQLACRLPDNVTMCRPIDPEAIAAEADVVFLCLPHRVSMQQVPALLDAGLRVIDLSADYRIADAAIYEQVYDHPHEDTENLKDAVYGLPELFRDDLPGAMLVANPGCYPTAAALGIAPLLARSLVKGSNIIINGVSGVTGAGRTPAPHLHFAEANEGYLPYGTIGAHRHQSEMEQTLATVMGHTVPLLFVPHLIPADRGILETIYMEPADTNVTQEDLYEAFDDAYADEPFVRVREELPNVKHVRGTNFCDVSVRLTPGDNNHPPRVVVFSAIDNMIKGASGQAIQNMNLIFEQPETAGLLP